MIIAVAAFVVFAVLVWLGRRARQGKGDWRIALGLLAAAAFVGSAFTGLRGSWVMTAVLDLVGLFLLYDLRRRGAPAAQPKMRREAATTTLSEADARAVLGLDPTAGPDEIQAAYLRLMRALHPDRGGSSPLAAQINAARDRLLGKA